MHSCRLVSSRESLRAKLPFDFVFQYQNISFTNVLDLMHFKDHTTTTKYKYDTIYLDRRAAGCVNVTQNEDEDGVELRDSSAPS